MITPRFFSHHPAASRYLSTKPHIFLLHPESFEVDKQAKGELKAQEQELAASKKIDDKIPVISIDRGVQIEDEGEAYCLSLDLPGVKSLDVKLQFNDGVLSIEAERKSGNKVVAKYVQAFVMDDQLIDDSKIQANLSDGVLSVTIPKKLEAKPIEIPVVAEHPPEAKEGDDDDDDHFQFSLDLPGVAKDDLKLAFHNGKIVLHAERKRGRFVGTIEKQFSVDAKKVDKESFQAYLLDGILTITADRKEATKPKTVVVSGKAPEKKVTEQSKKEDEIVVETVSKDAE